MGGIKKMRFGIGRQPALTLISAVTGGIRSGSTPAQPGTRGGPRLPPAATSRPFNSRGTGRASSDAWAVAGGAGEGCRCGAADGRVLRGNASCITQNGEEFTRFRRLGCNAMMADYEGYGLSGGRPSEAGCYATADAVLEHLVGHPGVDPAHRPGRALPGAAVAIDLASRRQVAGLIAISPFTSMRAMARRTHP